MKVSRLTGRTIFSSPPVPSEPAAGSSPHRLQLSVSQHVPVPHQQHGLCRSGRGPEGLLPGEYTACTCEV